MKKTLPPTYFVSAIVLVLTLHYLFPGPRIVPYPWNLIGMIPLIVGIVLNGLADRAFKRVNTTVKPFQESTFLVTSGVYKLTRNPMYVGMELILIGIILVLGSLVPFIVVPLLAFLIDRRFVRTEEQMLAERFGDRWINYKRNVHKWI